MLLSFLFRLLFQKSKTLRHWGLFSIIELCAEVSSCRSPTFRTIFLFLTKDNDYENMSGNNNNNTNNNNITNSSNNDNWIDSPEFLFASLPERLSKSERTKSAFIQC